MPRRSTEISALPEHGAHYTTEALCSQLVREALDVHVRHSGYGSFWNHSDVLGVRVADPACGDGNLLAEAAEQLASALLATPKHRALPMCRVSALGKVIGSGCVSGNDLRSDAACAAQARLPGAPISVGDGLGWSYPEGRLCVVMNPPFLGGGKISGQLGQATHTLTRKLTGSGRTDLAVAFLRSAALAVASNGGTLSAILPSAATEGDNRVFGLAALLSQGWRIVQAQTKRRWPGEAKVMFVIVHMVPPEAHA